MESAIRGARFSDAAKEGLLGLVASKPSTRQRPRQDFSSWPSFGTPRLWEEIARCPANALELIALHVNSMGLINPDKNTQKSLAAHICVAEMGDCPFPIGAEDANNRFKAVGKRLKQLYKAEPSEYLVRLPASPALLLKEHPVLAKSLYSRDKLPCACPLSAWKVAQAEANILCRVDKPLDGALVPKRKQAAAVPEQPQQLGMQQMQSMFMLMIQQFGRQMQQAAAGSQEQRAGVTFLPPGTLDASPVSKLQKLEADAFRSPSSGGSVVTGDDKPRRRRGSAKSKKGRRHA